MHPLRDDDDDDDSQSVVMYSSRVVMHVYGTVDSQRSEYRRTAAFPKLHALDPCIQISAWKQVLATRALSFLRTCADINQFRDRIIQRG